MDLPLESDAEALWQDTLDLLTSRNLPEATLAMLRNCTPASMENATLHLETPMRLVLKTVSKNVPVIEECLSQAAFEPMRLEVDFVPGAGAAQAPSHAPSSMSREEVDSWAAETGDGRPSWDGPAARKMAEDTWAEPSAEDLLEAAARRRRNNPLVEDISQATSKLTFERFVRGEENDIAYQAALQVANGMNSTYNPLFIYGKSGLGKTHLLRAVQNYIARNDPSRLCVYRDASTFITEYTEAMREFHPKAFGSSFLVKTAPLLGVRDSRRIEGDYIFTVQDWLDRKRFDDEIGRNCYYIDVHKEGHKATRYKKGESHGIPYRCLTPKGKKNLLVAGRCISTDVEASGSLRVMPPCLVTGEAAGMAAVHAIRQTGNDVHKIDVDFLRKRLKEEGQYFL